MSVSESNLATKLIKQLFEEVARDKQLIEEEKRKWEEEKAKIRCSDDRRIVLDVGGTRYSTSRSTLTKYPESMLGVMFSGRHDLEPMKCSDGSFFIDRDGTHFRHILNYLRDGEEVIQCFPKSAEALREILHEATYYQLEGLISTLSPLVREVNVVFQDHILSNFATADNYISTDKNSTDYNGEEFNTWHRSIQTISYQLKNMKNLSFFSMKFVHPVSFISCDLSNASFERCCFESDVLFKDCILANTKFTDINGLITNSHSVSFTGSKTCKTIFDTALRKALQSAGRIS
ncbi:uncharacterized protein [Dysidea avara]|uniref:uncharacterized protein n=1 Tax=Dysidea avara TaxID=196820 RepID=UPI0033179098